MFTSILVPLDGSPLAERALPHALALARAAKGKLILFRASPSRALVDGLAPKRAAMAELERSAIQLRASGVEVESYVSRVYQVEIPYGICEAAEEKGADLIVMSTHGYGGLGRWTYGSVADEVLRQASVPVVLVSATCEHRWPADHADRIVVPLDGSGFAEAALGPARALGEALQAELLLVRAVQPLDSSYADGTPYLEGRVETELSEARDYLESIANTLRAAGQAVLVHVEIGSPASTITNLARERGADLIAMATHGRSGLARLALGSVATGTLHLASVPLLLARPAALRRLVAEMAEAAARPEAVEEPVRPR